MHLQVKPLRNAFALAFAYGLTAAAYIWLSGVIAARIAADVHDLARIERLKGLAFVLATAVLLFLAAWLILRRLQRAIEERQRLFQATISVQSRVLAGELAAGVAHDFNNALMVAAFAITEVQGSSDAQTISARLRGAAEAIARGRELALRLARTARGERFLQTEQCDLVPIARSMLRALSKLPRLHDRRIETDICSEAVAEIDVVLFEQIIANLVLNAADACATKGVLRLVLASDSTHVRLEVHDNGPGIPVDRRESIFAAFETSKPQGLGLGLLSVRAAVQAQGGTLEVGTSPLGGAVFTVRLRRTRKTEGL